MKNRLAKRIAASAMAIAVTVTTLMGNTAAYTLADDTGSVEEAVQEEEIAEVAAVSDPDLAVESITAAVETEPAAEETAPEPEQEAVIVEETATIPEVVESEPAVVEEEETSGEGYEAGEYSETIDSGATEGVVVVDESVAEVTEDEAVADPAEVTEEVTEETEDVVETSEEIEEPAETTESEEAEAESIEEIEEIDAPVFVGSVDSGLTSQLTNVGAAAINGGDGRPYFNGNGSQTASGAMVYAGTRAYTASFNGGR